MLQVKNLPDDIHAKLSERARAEHVSMSEYVTRLLRRDLSQPTMSEWLATADVSPVREIDVVGALDEAREERQREAGAARP